jgi:hypothetical protein
MLPSIDFLQDDIPLYNNLARYKDHQGRLSAHLMIFPSPEVKWDYEVLGDEVKQKGQIHTEVPMSPLQGYQFVISKPLPTMDSHDFVTPKEGLSGLAFHAIFGDPEFKAHAFRFYLPNTRFQVTNLLGQQLITKVHKLEEEDLGQESGGRILEAKCDDTWHVSIRASEASLAWLEDRNNNIGTKITAIGYLHSNMGRDVKFVDYPTLTIKEAQNYIDILSFLFSFLNGGYVGPLLIEGLYHRSSASENISEPNAIVLAPRTTPLELTGNSWCTIDSDLPAYLACFPTLKKMLSQPPWDETFGLILSWYFQAIQPEMRLGGKMWQIVANALGTALERLGYTILVLEEEDPDQRGKNELLFSLDTKKAKKVWGLADMSTSVRRLQLLLERIGLSLDKGFWDVNEVKNFIDIRNESTHPKKGSVDRRHIRHILDQATQWVYEVILWRLGYTGNYLIRTAPGRQSIPHRYNLGARNPLW